MQPVVNLALLPYVRAKNRAVVIRRQTAFLAQVANVVAGRRDVFHQQRINDQQSDRDDGLRAWSGLDENKRCKEIADGDSLQHAGNANRGEMKVGKAGEKFAEQKDDSRAVGDLDK